MQPDSTAGVGFTPQAGERTFGITTSGAVSGLFEPEVQPWGPTGRGRLRSREILARRYGFTGPNARTISPRHLAHEAHAGTRDAELILVTARARGLLSGPSQFPTPQEISDLQWTWNSNGSTELHRIFDEIRESRRSALPELPPNLEAASPEVREAWERRWEGSPRLGTTVLRHVLQVHARVSYTPRIEVRATRMADDGPRFVVRRGVEIFAWDLPMLEAMSRAGETLAEEAGKWNPERRFEEYLLHLASGRNARQTNAFARWWRGVRDALEPDYVPPPPRRSLFGLASGQASSSTPENSP